jgi:hypothetical protein
LALITRREFTAGLAATAAAVAARAAAEGKPKPSVFGGVQVGVQSYTFRAFDIDRMIAAMTAVGLTSVELWNGHLDPTKATRRTSRRCAASSTPRASRSAPTARTSPPTPPTTTSSAPSAAPGSWAPT